MPIEHYIKSGDDMQICGLYAEDDDTYSNDWDEVTCQSCLYERELMDDNEYNEDNEDNEG